MPVLGVLRSFLPDAGALAHPGGCVPQAGLSRGAFPRGLSACHHVGRVVPSLKPWAVVPHLREISYWAGNKVLVSSRQACVSHCSPADLVTDLDFSPFDDFLLATGSADRTVSGAAG